MCAVALWGPNDNAIDDWRMWTRPKNKKLHWKPARSAMELARAWFTAPKPQWPPEVRNLIETDPRTRGLRLVKGWPEAITELPHGSRKDDGCNHDLLLYGYRNKFRVVVSVEAKADERFGSYSIGIKYKISNAARKAGSRTGIPNRIKALLKLVFGREARPDREPWRTLRYQLLTAISGTAIRTADVDADIGILIVHEFHTSDTIPRKIQINRNDFNSFLRELPGVNAEEAEEGRLYGPVILRQSRHLKRDVNIYVGKVVYRWPSK